MARLGQTGSLYSVAEIAIDVAAFMVEQATARSRWGATLAKTIDAGDSVKLYFSSGATARSGSNFNHVGVAWQHRWGAGL